MYTVSTETATAAPDIRESNDMGAIEPTVARNQAAANFKSASIESNNQPSSRSIRNQYDFDQISLMEPNTDYNNNINKPRNNSFHVKAKKFLTLTPGMGGGVGVGGFGLKPSASTSCLFTAEDHNSNNSSSNNSCNDDTSNAPVIIPTRASLTHEWKKLKTPNKCRECNLLVYFNGRECSFCGFVAHKKCVTILVIKCSGQQLGWSAAALAGAGAGVRANRKGQPEPLAVSSQQLAALNLTQSQLQQQVSARRNKQAPIQPIFGQPVSTDGRQVVDFVRRFIYEIDTRGLTSKGIYRVSSIKSKVDRLCNYYDQNFSSLVDLSSFHPNIIANALKMYLRQLPEPLLTHELYNNFIDIGKKYSSSNTLSTATNNNKDRGQTSPILDGWPTLSSAKQRKYYFPLSLTSAKPATTVTSSARGNIVINNPAYDPLLIVEFKEIIELLPPVNRELIAIIMRHLRRVADLSGENQMSAKNLSIIFGPTLLSSDNKSLAIVDNIHQARVIELMITWAEQIFPQYANYESKAVIDLDLSELENGIPYWHESRLFVDRTYGDEPETFSSENSDRRRRSRLDSQDIETNTNEPLSTKNRNNLRELRRQFFTVPVAQTKTPTQTEAPSPQFNTQSKQNTRAPPNHVEPRKAKLINPPGSVPVIKVRPYYCNKLTNNAENKPLRE